MRISESLRRAWPANVSWPVTAALLVVVYFIVARLGLQFATIGSSISPVWPPTGFAIAALSLVGRRYWPAILAGAFLANATTPVPLVAAFAIGCGNTGEALLGSYLMRGQLRLDEPAAVRNLVLVAAPAATFVSAGTGVVALSLAGAFPPGSGFWSALALWWAGDYVGALTVTPLIVTWATPGLAFAGRRVWIELGVIAVVVTVVAQALLGRLLPDGLLAPTLYPYLLFPLVIVAAIRTGPRGAAIATLVVALTAVGSAAQGSGPFAAQTIPSTAAGLLLYTAVLAVTGLGLGAEASQRRHTQTALLDAHENLRAIVQSSPLAIYTLGPAGTVLTWNAAAERLYGWTAGEVLGGPLPTSPEGEQVVLRRSILGGDAITGMEVSRRRKDGTPITINLSLAPLYGPGGGGQVTGVLAIAADMTALRQLEVQYRQSQKVEAIGQLAGGIAHDFNNILTAITSTTAVLLKQLPPNSPARADAEEISDAARRAGGLTRQLLAFSRRQVLELKPIDLNHLIGETERMLRRLLAEQIHLRTNLASGVGVVRGDAGQLEQVLLNLVVNARDAMPLGGAITISTSNTDVTQLLIDGVVSIQPGPYVLVEVSDTGEGMDADTRSHLFEPFFTTKGEGKGTGLGLATVYGIVKQSGGYIWAQSEPGKGSTFKILLPRVDTYAAALELEAAAPALGGRETILLVEDQRDVLRAMRRGLEALGYTVLAAKGGAEALAVAQRHGGAIHLLITDVVMPGMNGRDLAQGLYATRPETKVLYVSGYPDQSVVHQGLLAPGLAFLQKPFAPEALAQKVREVLGNRNISSARPTSRRAPETPPPTA